MAVQRDRLLVCGSRDWDDYTAMRRVLFGFLVKSGTLVHGAAPGADSMAGVICESHFGVVKVDPYPADWDQHGNAAGPIRNQQMLEEGEPDIVLAFVNKPLAESKGTRDMVQRSVKWGVPTFTIQQMGESLG